MLTCIRKLCPSHITLYRLSLRVPHPPGSSRLTLTNPIILAYQGGLPLLKLTWMPQSCSKQLAAAIWPNSLVELRPLRITLQTCQIGEISLLWIPPGKSQIQSANKQMSSNLCISSLPVKIWIVPSATTVATSETWILKEQVSITANFYRLCKAPSVTTIQTFRMLSSIIEEYWRISTRSRDWELKHWKSM